MSNTNLMGFSKTQPTRTGDNIDSSGLWTNYTLQGIDISTWLVSGTKYINDAPVTAFGQTNGPANTFYTLPYFIIYDLSSTFICAGSIGPPIYLGQGGIITFDTGTIQFDTSVPVHYLPDTTNIAFPTITYPVYVPTYEPAALSQPIVYNQNMRS